jgi:hypothetical protein
MQSVSEDRDHSGEALSVFVPPVIVDYGDVAKETEAAGGIGADAYVES